MNTKFHEYKNLKFKKMSKKITLLMVFTFCLMHFNASAQEKYGNTLNLGLGIGGYSGYYSYVGHTIPVFQINYEIDVANNFTLAPFIGFYSYTKRYNWNNKNFPDRYYTYRETVIPIGVKGSYYFDSLLGASDKWDFYLAGSLGFAIVKSSWDRDYYGDKDYYRRGSALYLDLHIGAEYHFNNTLGAFLDLSTGVSKVGLAFHL